MLGLTLVQIKMGFGDLASAWGCVVGSLAYILSSGGSSEFGFAEA